jgi:SAM-dependent methyltransferase
VLRRKRRDRAALADEGALYLHKRAAEDLLERLSLVNRGFDSALVIGCADRFIEKALKAKGVRVICADPGAAFARKAKGIQCEEDFLPFADSSFDLAMAVGTMESVNDLPGALTLIRKILRPDGLFLAALAGAVSLTRLRSALRAAEEAQGDGVSPRLHPQIDIRTAGDLLMRAGFALPVVDSDAVTIKFSHFFQLVADLRAMGGTNLLRQRALKPFSRTALASAIFDFANTADGDGKTSERFEILYLSGWAPSPDQPKPARRGSATASLAEALRKDKS